MIAAQPMYQPYEVDEQTYDNSYLNQPEQPTYPDWLLWQAKAWLWWQDVPSRVRWMIGVGAIVLAVALVVGLSWRAGVVRAVEPAQPAATIAPAGCYRGISISWLEDGQERPVIVAKLPKRGC
jgi:hypothetical protein